MNEKGSNEFIRVYCRVRPPNRKEDSGIDYNFGKSSSRRGRSVRSV